ncbi:diguanylate cyclase domain-containing protein [Aliidiomarina sp.]|uniref:sensor domain-containing diguanylate cyclase n=1 Tax=Aliidiomarina sp. TaxID=1872439 RepID=UPI003A4D91F7
MNDSNSALSTCNIGDINALPAGVLYVNHEGIIQYLNTTLQNWLDGIDCIGLPFADILSGAGRIFNLTHIQPSLQHSAQVEEMFVQLKSSAGSLVSLVLNAKRFANMDVYVFTPMGKRQHFEAEIINARKKAEQSAFATNEAYNTLQELQQALEESNRELEALASTDALTGIANRRHFQNAFKQQISIFERTQNPLALLMLDVDHFKSINDSAGHDVGDQTLQRLAELVSSCIRQGDIFARTGGEEFAIIMANTDLDTATNVAERIRTLITTSKFPHQMVTISCGIAVAKPADTPQSLYMRADKALYVAKNNGRNRTEVAE